MAIPNLHFQISAECDSAMSAVNTTKAGLTDLAGTTAQTYLSVRGADTALGQFGRVADARDNLSTPLVMRMSTSGASDVQRDLSGLRGEVQGALKDFGGLSDLNVGLSGGGSIRQTIGDVGTLAQGLRDAGSSAGGLDRIEQGGRSLTATLGGLNGAAGGATQGLGAMEAQGARTATMTRAVETSADRATATLGRFSAAGGDGAAMLNDLSTGSQVVAGSLGDVERAVAGTNSQLATASTRVATLSNAWRAGGLNQMAADANAIASRTGGQVALTAAGEGVLPESGVGGPPTPPRDTSGGGGGGGGGGRGSGGGGGSAERGAASDASKAGEGDIASALSPALMGAALGVAGSLVTAAAGAMAVNQVIKATPGLALEANRAMDSFTGGLVAASRGALAEGVPAFQQLNSAMRPLGAEVGRIGTENLPAVLGGATDLVQRTTGALHELEPAFAPAIRGAVALGDTLINAVGSPTTLAAINSVSSALSNPDTEAGIGEITQGLIGISGVAGRAALDAAGVFGRVTGKVSPSAQPDVEAGVVGGFALQKAFGGGPGGFATAFGLSAIANQQQAEGEDPTPGLVTGAGFAAAGKSALSALFGEKYGPLGSIAGLGLGEAVPPLAKAADQATDSGSFFQDVAQGAGAGAFIGSFGGPIGALGGALAGGAAGGLYATFAGGQGAPSAGATSAGRYGWTDDGSGSLGASQTIAGGGAWAPNSTGSYSPPADQTNSVGLPQSGSPVQQATQTPLGDMLRAGTAGSQQPAQPQLAGVGPGSGVGNLPSQIGQLGSAATTSAPQLTGLAQTSTAATQGLTGMATTTSGLSAPLTSLNQGLTAVTQSSASLGQAIQPATQAAQALPQAVQPAMSSLSSLPQQASDAMSSANTAVAQGGSALGQAVPTSMASGIQASTGSACDASATMAASTANCAASALQTASPSKVFTRLGESTGQGMAVGIANSAGGATSAVRDAMGDVVTAGHEGLDAHSPSLLFQLLGEGVPLGLAIGIANQSKAAINAAGGVANDLLDHAGGVLDASTLSPNVAPLGSSGLPGGMKPGADPYTGAPAEAQLPTDSQALANAATTGMAANGQPLTAGQRMDAQNKAYQATLSDLNSGQSLTQAQQNVIGAHDKSMENRGWTQATKDALGADITQHNQVAQQLQTTDKAFGAAAKTQASRGASALDPTNAATYMHQFGTSADPAVNAQHMAQASTWANESAGGLSPLEKSMGMTAPTYEGQEGGGSTQEKQMAAARMGASHGAVKAMGGPQGAIHDQLTGIGGDAADAGTKAGGPPMKAMGHALSSGAVAGMLGNQGAVAAAGSSIASLAVNSVANTAQIHSPSRVMMGHGEMMSEGFRRGIRDGGWGPIRAMRDMVRDVLDGGRHEWDRGWGEWGGGPWGWSHGMGGPGGGSSSGGSSGGSGSGGGPVGGPWGWSHHMGGWGHWRHHHGHHGHHGHHDWGGGGEGGGWGGHGGEFWGRADRWMDRLEHNGGHHGHHHGHHGHHGHEGHDRWHGGPWGWGGLWGGYGGSGGGDGGSGSDGGWGWGGWGHHHDRWRHHRHHGWDHHDRDRSHDHDRQRDDQHMFDHFAADNTPAITTQASQLGQAVTQGMSQGMTQNAAQVTQAAKQVADRAINQAKSSLGIASPSRVFHEIGLNTMSGFEIGLYEGMTILGSHFGGDWGHGWHGFGHGWGRHHGRDHGRHHGWHEHGWRRERMHEAMRAAREFNALDWDRGGDASRYHANHEHAGPWGATVDTERQGQSLGQIAAEQMQQGLKTGWVDAGTMLGLNDNLNRYRTLPNMMDFNTWQMDETLVGGFAQSVQAASDGTKSIASNTGLEIGMVWARNVVTGADSVMETNQFSALQVPGIGSALAKTALGQDGYLPPAGAGAEYYNVSGGNAGMVTMPAVNNSFDVKVQVGDQAIHDIAWTVVNQNNNQLADAYNAQRG